jgi:dUTP pyrophosphatase
MSTSIEVNVRYLHPVWETRELGYATEHSAGLDLRACLDEERATLEPGQRLAIGAGIALEIMVPGVAGFVFSRSGLGTKEGLVVSQGVGVIDPDYRGEVVVSLLNNSGQTREVERGQRIAQLLFLPVYQARLLTSDRLGDTSRGHGGFGHTGRS